MPLAAPACSSTGFRRLPERRDYLVGAGAGAEDGYDSHFEESGAVLGRNDAPHGEGEVIESCLLQRRDDLGHELHVGAGQDAQPDGVHLLVAGLTGNLAGRLADARVADVEPSLLQQADDHARAAVVAIEARLGDEDARSVGQTDANSRTG